MLLYCENVNGITQRISASNGSFVSGRFASSLSRTFCASFSVVSNSSTSSGRSSTITSARVGWYLAVADHRVRHVSFRPVVEGMGDHDDRVVLEFVSFELG